VAGGGDEGRRGVRLPEGAGQPTGGGLVSGTAGGLTAKGPPPLHAPPSRTPPLCAVCHHVHVHVHVPMCGGECTLALYAEMRPVFSSSPG
jgi:hypothetical protein